jgi:hypothetical protein
LPSISPPAFWSRRASIDARDPAKCLFAHLEHLIEVNVDEQIIARIVGQVLGLHKGIAQGTQGG